MDHAFNLFSVAQADKRALSVAIERGSH